LAVIFDAGGDRDHAPSPNQRRIPRKISASLSPRLGQPIVIDNRPGAASVLGSEFVAKSAPDGYTLMYTANLLSVLPALYKKLPFDPVADFTHISKVGTGGVALLVNPRVLPLKSLDELIARARAQPGKLTSAHPASAPRTISGWKPSRMSLAWTSSTFHIADPPLL
jgi:tripartite-type tricarboxylate transporter receptor subunit TctC